jgi:hypothetical protein
MAKSKIIYQAHETIRGREKGFGEWIEYDALITIKAGVKNPITIDMTFDSIQPFAKELPKTYKIRAENLTKAYSKVIGFFNRYGFVVK